jgi:tripartite-type tricarboxylate transporter receptor subunit TctC
MKKLLIALAATLGLAVTAHAQTYPSHPITVIVPFAAGGPTDIIARIVGENMGKTLGQQLVIENVAGAGGTTGTTRAAQAAPDGYTIMMGHMGTHGAAPGMYPKLRYDPVKDFAPIGMAAGTPILIVSRKDFPATDLKSFVAYLQANQDKVNEAHAGAGSVSHTTCTMFNVQIGVKPTLVPYSGTGPVLNDLVAGKVDYACDQIVNLVEQIKGGTIKAYGIATPKRSPALPDVPTTIEAGLPEFQVSAWNALFAPKGTPTEIVTKLTTALNKALDDPDTKKRLLDLGGVLPEGQERTSAWLGTFVAQEVARWTPIIQKGGAVQAQ